MEKVPVNVIYLCISLQISIVMNKITGKPRGYAFIIYEKERDMHCKIYMYMHMYVMLRVRKLDEGGVNCTFEKSWSV